MNSFNAHGKLLLTGEYLVLKGAVALALPTKLGQTMTVETSPETSLRWNAYKPNAPWFSATVHPETLEIVDGFYNQDDEEESVIRIDAANVQKIADGINKIAKSKKLDRPILSVPMELRHMVFVILSEFVPNITVLACEELVGDCNMKFVGKV